MRLLKLRIENINSLAGRYEIDFTNRDYVESGIFAIVGPTGSGKTTILDAVTPALFGKTPRMETRTSTSKKTESRLYGSDRRPQTMFSLCCLRIHGKDLAVALER